LSNGIRSSKTYSKAYSMESTEAINSKLSEITNFELFINKLIKKTNNPSAYQ